MTTTDAKDIVEGIKSGVQLGATNFAIPAVDFFVAANPDWMVPWLLAKGFFGVLFGFQQEKINWFVQYLEENKGDFSQELVATKEFQEGFLITFENYVRQRGETRRKLIEQIFLDFSKSVNKDEFELERMYRTSELISLDSVRFLGFIQSIVIPNLTNEIQNGSAASIKLSEVLGDFFRQSNNTQTYYDFAANYIEYLSELNVLGVLTIKGYKTVINQGETNMIMGFTDFGTRFIKYVLNLSATEAKALNKI